MRNTQHDLCMELGDSFSAEYAIKKATAILKSTGHIDWANEMNQRIATAKGAEDLFSIIDDYVEII